MNIIAVKLPGHIVTMATSCAVESFIVVLCYKNFLAWGGACFYTAKLFVSSKHGVNITAVKLPGHIVAMATLCAAESFIVVLCYRDFLAWCGAWVAANL